MDLDQHHALQEFLGKTEEQATAMFAGKFHYYYEDLCYMRGPAFRFYLPAAIKYLLSDDADGDSDAVSVFCFVLESRSKENWQDLIPIRAIVIESIRNILAKFDRFDVSTDIYGDLPARYEVIAA